MKKPVKLKYEEPDELKRAPHSFVIHRGKVGKYILELEKDFRKVMDPFTASSLQVLFQLYNDWDIKASKFYIIYVIRV